MRYLLKFRKDQAGGAAIEFGLLAPVLFLLFMGIIELGLLLFYITVVETSTTIATRTASIQAAGQANPVEGTIRAEVSNRSANLINGGALNVNPVVVSPAAQAADGATVLYIVTYPYNFFTPLLGNILGNNGQFMITSSILIKNEPV